MSDQVAIAIENFKAALRRLEEAVAAGIEDPDPKYTAALIEFGRMYLKQIEADAQEQQAHGAATVAHRETKGDVR